MAKSQTQRTNEYRARIKEERDALQAENAELKRRLAEISTTPAQPSPESAAPGPALASSMTEREIIEGIYGQLIDQAVDDQERDAARAARDEMLEEGLYEVASREFTGCYKEHLKRLGKEASRKAKHKAAPVDTAPAPKPRSRFTGKEAKSLHSAACYGNKATLAEFEKRFDSREEFRQMIEAARGLSFSDFSALLHKAALKDAPDSAPVIEELDLSK